MLLMHSLFLLNYYYDILTSNCYATFSSKNLGIFRKFDYWSLVFKASQKLNKNAVILRERFLYSQYMAVFSVSRTLC